MWTSGIVMHGQRFMVALATVALASFVIGFSSGAQASVVHPQAGTSVSWVEPELAKAFEHYWSSLAKGDVDACYAIEAPHFRFLVDRERYGNYVRIVISGTITGVEILNPVVRTAFFVEVPMWVLKSSNSGESMRIGMRDRWVKVNGQWYHLVRDPMVFPDV
ncbi:hypothetical protein [Desulfosoma sp.]